MEFFEALGIGLVVWLLGKIVFSMAGRAGDGLANAVTSLGQAIEGGKKDAQTAKNAVSGVEWIIILVIAGVLIAILAR